jgi:hypothetical protein
MNCDIFDFNQDAILIKGIAQFGKVWAKIATLLRGRTRNQCKDHWEHTLNPVLKTGPWTEEEVM